MDILEVCHPLDIVPSAEWQTQLLPLKVCGGILIELCTVRTYSTYIHAVVQYSYTTESGVQYDYTTESGVQYDYTTESGVQYDYTTE